MLKTGEWLSLSIIGLVVLFIFLAISFFSFLIGPNSTGPQTTVDPATSFIQVVFISIGPAIALSFFTNVFSKDISKLSATFVLFSGVILIIGMIYVSFLVPNVQNIDLPDWIDDVPFIFIGFGVLLFLIGLINYKRSGKQKQNISFELD